MKKLLIVVDYQNDFVDGSLGFQKAVELEKHIVKLIKKYKENNDEIIYTLDTHYDNYNDTLEGKHLPVPHCIKNTYGWQLYGQTRDLLKDCRCFEKNTFPSLSLANYLVDKQYEDITLVGVVSHICVLSNAIMVKSALPEIPIYIDLNGTASHDDLTHEKCLDVLKSLQIELIK